MFIRTSRIAVVFVAALFAACGDTRESPAKDGSIASYDVASAPPPPQEAPVSFAESAPDRGSVTGVGAGGVAGKMRAGAPGSRPEGQGGQTLPTGSTPQAAADAVAMVIRTANASVEVRVVDSAMVRLRSLAQSLGGFVANESVSGGKEQPRTAMLELKIPAARFDQAIAGLNPLGRVEHVSVNTEDVGEEYVDIQARIANAKRLETRLIDLLRTHTGRLQDLLAVERELARIREEIERFEGRARFLRTRVSMSTLSVHLHEPAPLIGSQPGPNRITNAVRMAWRNFVGFFAWLIEMSGIVLPLAAIIALIWWAVRRVRRSRPVRRDAEDRGATGEG